MANCSLKFEAVDFENAMLNVLTLMTLKMLVVPDKNLISISLGLSYYLWKQCSPVVTYDIISLHGFELSNQIDCNNLVGPIGNLYYFHELLASVASFSSIAVITATSGLATQTRLMGHFLLYLSLIHI